MQASLLMDGGIALGAEFGYGVSNGVVQAAVQGTVFVDAEGSSRSKARSVMAWHKFP